MPEGMQQSVELVKLSGLRDDAQVEGLPETFVARNLFFFDILKNNCTLA